METSQVKRIVSLLRRLSLRADSLSDNLVIYTGEPELSDYKPRLLCGSSGWPALKQACCAVVAAGLPSTYPSGCETAGKGIGRRTLPDSE